MSLPLLRNQPLVRAPPATKIRLAFLGTALADALGAPAEFQARFSFDFIEKLEPNDNFGLPAGVWTDDTSMALGLARAIAGAGPASAAGEKTDGAEQSQHEDADGFSEAAQLDAYFRWWTEGVLSATGACFDIGNTIQRALSYYRNALREAGAGTGSKKGKDNKKGEQQADADDEEERKKKAATTALAHIQRDLAKPVFGGNGSLMRVLPVGLAYFADPATADAYARRSGAVTHPNAVCVEACGAWAAAVARIVSVAWEEGKEDGGSPMRTKVDVLHHFAAYPWRTAVLRDALAGDAPYAGAAGDAAAMEAHYEAHHPLLRLRGAHAPPEDSGEGEETAASLRARLPPASALPSSGYVVHTLAAALYAFLGTRTFAGGAALCANMGDDADTVGAVYGGLAGCWYAREEGASAHGEGQGEDGLFWGARVREWRVELVRRELVEEVAEELVAFVERRGVVRPFQGHNEPLQPNSETKFQARFGMENVNAIHSFEGVHNFSSVQSIAKKFCVLSELTPASVDT
ncbi:ADP-ribosylation/Crystallin J1 [Mycena sp. CBHHK59/15]|nr:ADP-ribosylation/Crystallin J1 [Mycena sp. CBHHK59/15]